MNVQSRCPHPPRNGSRARFRKGAWNEDRASRLEETFWKLQDSLIGFRRLLRGLTPAFFHRIQLEQGDTRICVFDRLFFMAGAGVCGRPYCFLQ